MDLDCATFLSPTLAVKQLCLSLFTPLCDVMKNGEYVPHPVFYADLEWVTNQRTIKGKPKRT